MIQEPHEQAKVGQDLPNRLHALSFREQLDILMRATQHLPARNRAEILGSAGLRLLKTRFLPMLIHFLFKRFVKGVLWSVMSVVIVVLCLVLLAFIEQINPRAVTPVIIAVVISFLAYIISSIIAVGRDIRQLTRKTCSKEERTQLLQKVNNLNQPEKIVALRTLGIELSRRGAGEPIIAPFLIELALLIAIGLLIGLILLISSLSVAAPILSLVAVILGLLVGFYVPYLIHHNLSSHQSRTVMPGQKDAQEFN